jgi:hypothetical protein
MKRKLNLEKIVKTITEEQASNLFYLFQVKFNWEGTYFSQEDIVNHWENTHDNEAEGYFSLSQDQIDKVMATRIWSKHLEDALIREGSEVVADAVHEVMGSACL